MNGFRCVLAAVGFSVFGLAQPHGGRFDAYGCHKGTKAGEYHCHRGPLADQTFKSKEEMIKALEKLESGKDAPKK